MARIGREFSIVPVMPIRDVNRRIEAVKVIRMRTSLSATNMTSAPCQANKIKYMTIRIVLEEALLTIEPSHDGHD